jgi:hypothetical protein
MFRKLVQSRRDLTASHPKSRDMINNNNINNVTDLTNALPGNSSVNTVQHAKIEEAVFL